MDNKKHSLLLKNVPLDIRRYLLQIQGNVKVAKGVNQYSLEQTIYKIINEHRDKK